MDRYHLPVESCGRNWDRLRKVGVVKLLIKYQKYSFAFHFALISVSVQCFKIVCFMFPKAVTGGYFVNSAKKDPQEGYKTLVESQPVTF